MRGRRVSRMFGTPTEANTVRPKATKFGWGRVFLGVTVTRAPSLEGGTPAASLKCFGRPIYASDVA